MAADRADSGEANTVDHQLSIKRIYEPAAAADGLRVLVDRLWPRGLTKAEAKIDLWLKDVAPSPELRRWFDHRVERWLEFRMRYETELAVNPALTELRDRARRSDVTLLYAAKDVAHNHALVLAEVIRTENHGRVSVTPRPSRRP